MRCRTLQNTLNTPTPTYTLTTLTCACVHVYTYVTVCSGRCRTQHTDSRRTLHTTCASKQS